MIGMLKVANNGNDLLQILDALTDTKEEVISSDAVDFSGQPVNFWYKRRGAKKHPFSVLIYTRLCFFYIKKGLINVYGLFVSFLTLL